MSFYYEWGIDQLHKQGEELCGDSVAVSRQPQSVTLALSDGLGSGVKANILSTLTTQIAMHLLENDLPLEEVVQTLSETLPVCTVRKLAYSTFAIAQFFSEGFARLVGFDSPPVILLRDRTVQPVVCEDRLVDGKRIHECRVDLELGDWIVFVSDGVLNAGIGGVYPLGWGWENAARFLEGHTHGQRSAQDVAEELTRTVGDLYAGGPGDDVSVVVIKARRKLVATVWTGPPANREEDERLVDRLVNRGGRVAVCGGTTAKIAARHLGEPLEVDLETATPDVPARARIEGIDVVTEGILTLTRVRELLKTQGWKDDIRFRTDGAAELLRLLTGVDQVHFLVGEAVNPAHQNPDLPQQLELRHGVVREIGERLRAQGKEVSMESV